ASGLVSVNYNNIQDAFSGIFVNYNYQQKAGSNNNYITLHTRNDNVLRYGINHSSSTGSAMWTNSVTTSTGSMTGSSDGGMRAFYSAYNTGVNVSCNIESKTTSGYEFMGTNAGTQWHVNDIEDNQKGFVLNGNGIIGPQGSSTAASNNRWLGSSWNISNVQTYVSSTSNAMSSPLYVQTSGIYAPIFNDGLPLKSYATYLFPATGGYTCPPPLPPGLGEIGEYESMIRNGILLSTSSMPRKWINQFELWRSVLYDTALVDSSVAIAQFAAMAQHSRYSYLTNLENQLAYGNVDSALVLLGYDIDTLANTDTDAVTGVRVTDSVTADNIVMNYQKFYNIYIKYMEVAMSPEDSVNLLALAQLCPHIDGKVVYQARALYSFVFNDLNMFNDDSCMGVDTMYVGEWKHGGGSVTAQDIGGQGYKLHPNPNNGNITLQQLVSDTGIVRIEVYDVVGRSIYRNKRSFINKTTNLHLDNIVPGVYLLQIIGVDDKAYRFKFVKE
ncbi:MAG: peptidase and matrixin and adamalysin, partial [Flavipsychrobacter sp.]|nr:peptidase and matrixin and adamalysin [Flavipsychrobacter sp.]